MHFFFALLFAQALRDSITVTARAPEPRDEATAAVSVLTKNDIEKTPAAALPELVQRVPGITMYFDSDFASGTPWVTARGFFGGGEVEYVKVLVDGVPVADAESGLADWRHWRADEISRIEVLRGPASALYGDTALGGVIEVFTAPNETGNGTSGTARVTSGSFGTNAIDLNARNDSGALRTTLALFDATTDGYRDHGGNADRGADLSLQRFGDTDRLQLSLSYARKHRNDPGPLTEAQIAANPKQASPFFSFDDERSDRRRIAVTYENFSALQSRVTVFANDRNSDWLRTFLIAPQFGTTMLRNLTTKTFGASGDVSHDFASLTLRAGAEGGRDRIDSDYSPVIANGVFGPVAASDAATRTKIAGFATANVRLAPRLELVAGVRRDDIRDTRNGSDFNKAATSPRVGINLHLGSDTAPPLVVYAQASDAFKAPTLDQLFDARPFPAGGGHTFTISSPDLQPQRARNYELGASRTTSRFTWSVAAYAMRVRDEIDLDIRTFTYRNIGTSRHKGIEVMGEMTAGALRPLFTYAYTHVEDTANPGQQLKNIPEHVAQLGFTTTLPAQIDATAIGHWRHNLWLDDDGAFKMPEVTTLDLRFARRFGRARATLDVLNATNKRYNELGYVLADFKGNPTVLEWPAPSRAVRVTLSLAR